MAGVTSAPAARAATRRGRRNDRKGTYPGSASRGTQREVPRTVRGAGVANVPKCVGLGETHPDDDYASHAAEAAPLAGIVRVAGARVVRPVAPLALNLPVRAVAREGDRRSTEGPRALVAVLAPLRVVPRARARGVGHRLRQ